MTSQPNEILVDAIRGEIVSLWGDLSSAINESINHQWSIRCDGLTERIVELSHLVGPTSWEEIGVGLLESGVYERIYHDAGIDYPPVDHGKVEQVRQRAELERSCHLQRSMKRSKTSPRK